MIWIIHNSKTGNSKKLSEEIGKQLRDRDLEVEISKITDINSEKIADSDVLIVGARIIAGNADKKLRKFVKDLSFLKAACFYTHLRKWSPNWNKLAKFLIDEKVTTDVLSDVLNIKLTKMKGPAEPGQEDKIKEFVNKVAEFFS